MSLLRDTRQRLDLRQEDVAHAVGVTKQEVSYWELGQRMPTSSRLSKLATILGLTTDSILQDMEKAK